MIAVALALVLGFILGVGAGATRAMAIARATRGSSASMARFLPDAMPHRTVADVLAGRVRVKLGGTEYPIPVLARGASRRWLAELDAKWGALPAMLERAGDDVDAGVRLLVQHTDLMLDALLAYDQSGILPPRAELDAGSTDAEILQAIVECWLAANPLAASIVGAMENETNGTLPGLPSSVPTPTAGVPPISSST
jgi:hypothetical protein